MMAIMISKWAVAVLVVLSVLLALFLVGKKSVRADVEISASPQEVWAVLTDVARAGEWNTVLVPQGGELREGNSIQYEFFQEEGGKPSVMNAKVKQLEPHALINQAGGIPGVLTFDHRYVISSDEEGYTTVTIREEYRGIMVPFWNPEPVERAYGRLLGLLKERVLEVKGTHELN